MREYDEKEIRERKNDQFDEIELRNKVREFLNESLGEQKFDFQEPELGELTNLEESRKYAKKLVDNFRKAESLYDGDDFEGDFIVEINKKNDGKERNSGGEETAPQLVDSTLEVRVPQQDSSSIEGMLDKGANKIVGGLDKLAARGSAALDGAGSKLAELTEKPLPNIRRTPKSIERSNDRDEPKDSSENTDITEDPPSQEFSDEHVQPADLNESDEELKAVNERQEEIEQISEMDEHGDDSRTFPEWE